MIEAGGEGREPEASGGVSREEGRNLIGSAPASIGQAISKAAISVAADLRATLAAGARGAM